MRSNDELEACHAEATAQYKKIMKSLRMGREAPPILCVEQSCTTGSPGIKIP